MQFKTQHVIFAIAFIALLFMLSKQQVFGPKKEACCGNKIGGY